MDDAMRSGFDLGGIFPRRYHDEYLTIANGDNHRVWDTAGEEYIDLVAGNQNVTLGHSNDAIADAVRDQMTTLEHMGMYFATKPAMEYTSALTDTAPAGFETAWLVPAGSLATESALKLAHQYHTERGSEGKYKVISRRNNYHGSTAGAMAMNGYGYYTNRWDSLYQDYPVIASGTPYRCERCDGDGGHRCGVECANELEYAIQTEGQENVAAFIAEPICGTGNPGAMPHDGYFERIREICDEYDVLFIVDEVMTGLGRSGKMFSIEYWDVTPDIIVAGKGMGAGYMPLAGMLPHERIVDVFQGVDAGFWHGHTDAFHTASAAAGLAVLEYIAEHDVVANARTVGETLKAELEALDHRIVGDVRGKGLQLGVEFVADPETKEPIPKDTGFSDMITEAAVDNGLLVDWCGAHLPSGEGDAVLVTPPLTMPEEAVEEVVIRFDHMLTDLESELPALS